MRQLTSALQAWPAVGSETHFFVDESQWYPLPQTVGPPDCVGGTHVSPSPARALQVAVSAAQMSPMAQVSLPWALQLAPAASRALHVPLFVERSRSHQRPTLHGHAPPAADRALQAPVKHSKPDPHGASSAQEAPFTHGFDVHSSMLVSQLVPV